MPANSIVNIPPKQLLCDFSDPQAVVNLDFYPNPNGSDDPWWAGSSTAARYTWTLTLNVTPTAHGSHLTPNPFLFDGRDVDVGDWLCDDTGRVWYIRSVVRKEPTEVTIVVEDWNRYNTFSDSNGTGIPESGKFIIFETNEVGEPLFSDIPLGYVNGEFYANVNSYFKYVNPCRNYSIKQANHGFEIGQKLSIQKDSPNNFVPTNNNNVDSYVGVVSQVFSEHDFMFTPNSRITTLKSAYGFDVGAKLYVNDGELTEDKGSLLLYIVVRKERPSVIVGTVASPELVDGSKFKIGNYEVTTGTTIDSIVDFINNDVNNTIYTASTIGTSTEARRVASNNLAYGVVGGFIPFTFSINGNNVTVNSDASGSQAYGAGIADHNDIAAAINTANIAGIEADVIGSFIIIKNKDGGAIEIVTVTPDPNGMQFAGSPSMTGLPAFTPASSDKFLRITRLDGAEIVFKDIISNPVERLGLSQSRSGEYPTVVSLEQGIRKGESYIVSDMAHKDALSPLVGDQAFVLDSGNGEWSMHMYTTNGWVLTATEDSARTDADVLSVEVDFNSPNEVLVGTVSNNSRVSDITIEILEDFDVDVDISVGDEGDNSRLISSNKVDSEVVGKYSNTPSHIYTGNDTDIMVYCDMSGATRGRFKVIVSYS